MTDIASWHGTSTNRQVHLIDDLLGTILLLAAAAFIVLLDLTRRQLCQVYQLAFVLCAVCAFFIVGGLIDHHLSNDHLTLALYGSYLPSSTITYIYLPIFATVVVSLGFLMHLTSCKCDCCCLVGAKCTTHQRCLPARIRANASLYITCLLAVYIAIGTRLNVRLRESAIHPVGGTVHWAMLRSPFYLAMVHIASILFVILKLFLQHCGRNISQASSADFLLDKSPNVSMNSYPPLTTASPIALEELMRPPPSKPISSSKDVHTFSASLTSSATNSSPRHGGRGIDNTRLTLQRHKSQPLTVTRLYKPEHMNTPRSDNNDGDVSSLISSDSESDDDILEQSFKVTAHSASLAPPPMHKHQPLANKPVHPGYATPTSSPTSNVLSHTDFFASSGRQRMRARPRSTSNASSSSTALLSGSDNEDAVSDFHSDRPSSASSSSASYGLRRRAAPRVDSPNRSIQGSKQSEWIECYDTTSGNLYYYNPHTGESRWEKPTS